MTLAGFPCNSIGNEGVAPGLAPAPECTAIASADEKVSEMGWGKEGVWLYMSFLERIG